MIDPTSIHALSDFQRNAKKHLQRLKKTGRPEVLTVNGKPAAVVQDPEAYKRFIEYALGTSDVLAVDQAMEDVAAGNVRDWKTVRAELLAKHGAKKPRRRSA